MSVLCLITNPNDPDLPNTLMEDICKEIGGEPNWLDLGIACEIIDPKSTDTLNIAKDMSKNHAVDCALVPKSNRRKKLLIADMDSTMIDQECIDELADALNIKDQVADITERAMRGELDFGEALDTRVALLKGLDTTRIEEVRRERITYASGGRVLVQTMKEYGAYSALVSGGFTYFADYFGKRIGFDEATANILEFDGDVLTGTVTKPIVDSNTKVERLRALAAQNELDMNQTLAVGDGANDLPMLQVSGMGVALHAKPSVAEAANFRIDHGDLTALLYLQGYSGEDFVR